MVMMKEVDLAAQAVARLTERDVELDMLEREKECLRLVESGRCDGSCPRPSVLPRWYCRDVLERVEGGGEGSR